jgi:methyltransferase-like protein
MMESAQANRYDEVPYDSHPRYATHPDCMATLATLLGMKPAPPRRCRVLELGCASGDNLLPLAEAFPDSRFVGVDLSTRQIDAGRSVAAVLGLHNLDLQARSILDVDESFGEFDYIISHGVYSWVPEPVRSHLLTVCKRNLAANGVAYVSYNAFPGWRLREPVREMMNYHLRGVSDPQECIAQSRALLDFLAQAAPSQDGLWAQLLREEKKLIGPERDSYLFHEHLEEENQPFYFYQFMERATAHGLQYLGEAQGHLQLAAYPPEVQETLKGVSADLLQLEQYVDFIRNRTFRRTLLVHDEVALNRAPAPEVVYPLKASSLARPVGKDLDVFSTAAVEFKNDEGSIVETRTPLAKAALTILFRRWPQLLPFEDLWQQVWALLGPEKVGGPAEVARPMLARSLVNLYLSNLTALHVELPPFVKQAGERPCTTPLIRLQARTGVPVANRLHRIVKPSVLDRAILHCLDGNRNRLAVVQVLVEKVAKGELQMQQDGQPLTDPAAVSAVLHEELEASLLRLGLSAVLIA